MSTVLRICAIASITLGTLFFSSCATIPEPEAVKPQTVSPGKSADHSRNNLSQTQKLLVEEAERLIGAEKIFVRGRSFSHDCSGTVMAIYWYAGIDLTRDFPKYTGGGTERIYKYLKHEGLLYRTKLPVPGDIIFWDNTYDKNKNGKLDDYLTHMGMVVHVDEDGTIQYIHENYRKGIIMARMNLNKSNKYFEIIDGKKIILNDPIRMKGSPKSNKWLSSQLYRDFAMGYLLH